MLYPVYVQVGDADHAHGVSFPDFPGCFSAADTWSDLPAAVQEAVEAHFNGSLPSNLVQQIDAWAEAHHMTRSGFLASAVKQAMAASNVKRING
jgi:predicted RNase H-like HicB family nuclease